MNTRNKTSKIAQEKLKLQEKLNANDKTIQRNDSRMLSTTGTMDLGPVNFKAKISEHEGDIMAVATKDVVTIPPTTTIMGAIKTMTHKGFRRVPITDAGTNRLEGVVTSVDVIDFLGGGSKNLLVENRFKGNLLAAINADVREIMRHNISHLNEDANISDALKMMSEEKTGGLPVLSGDGRVRAICTEKDFVKLVAGIYANKSVGEYMTTKVKTTKSDTSIFDAAKIMVDQGFRRLPVVTDSILIGVVTASDIMNFIGSGEAFNKLITGNIHEAFDAPISSLISKDVVWASSDLDIGEAAAIMIEKNVGSIPIIDDGVLCGILTERDILRSISE
ncbi:MAG TPA: CBS domain-containing protein [Methanosarcinaceae archaeon]|nr:CBS domain-containing protein [Methanosarcinaceae archaeon]